MLFPTLIAACYEHLGNAAVAGIDLAMDLLAEFLEGNVRAWHADEPPVDGVARAFLVRRFGRARIVLVPGLRMHQG